MITNKGTGDVGGGAGAEIPNFDAPLYETPESAGKGSSFETPEQKSLKNIAIALRGIEAQLVQLNKNLRKK